MTPISHLLIRADAGGTLGTGHVMRMIALAQAWQDRGGNVTIAACQCPDALIERLKSEQIWYHDLGNLPLGGIEDLDQTIQLGKSLGAEWVVIDGYHFGEEYQKTLKINDFKILAVDDYGHCDAWHADVLLNQNLQDAIRATTTCPITPSTRILLGPRYALLRREFRKDPSPEYPPPSERKRILMTFGGVDPTGASLKVLQVLNGCPDLVLHLKVLAGPANPNLEAIRQEVLQSPHRIDLIAATHDMPALYRWAERVISAGGSTCYEWLFFGLPGWVTSVAANQDRIVYALLEGNLAAGLADITGLPKSALAQSLMHWLTRPPLVPQIRLVDGWGAPRLAAAMSRIPCWVRPVDTMTDARFLFELANEPSVRSAGRHTQVIQWEEHLNWLQRHCDSGQSHLMVVEMLEQGPVGQIRFHEHNDNTWEIGISIHPRHRQEGLGSTALSLAMLDLSDSVKVLVWLAEIRTKNIASHNLFAKLGFTLNSCDGDMQTWSLAAENI
ncbi:MAG: UDP-2,4-diacetamido-2,4,6-trideoxy-beta-L-altropyranose hydrolase [Verrucomicrobiota bacterium]